MAQRLSRPLLLIGLVLAVTVLPACDGDDEAKRREAAIRARAERRHQVSSEVIVRAYQEGRLGPPEEVKAEIDQVARKVMRAGEPAPSLFDVEGNMLTYDRLHMDGRVVFTEWLRTSARLDRAVGQELIEARQTVDAED